MSDIDNLIVKIKNNDSTLSAVSFSNVEFDDEDAKDLADALSSNQTLLSINLFDNNISDTGIIALAKALGSNKTIVTIDFEYSKFGLEGIKQLAEMLQCNQSITEIKLGFNNIRNADFTVITEALKYNQTLTHLCIRFNPINNEGAKAIIDLLSFNYSLISINFNRQKIDEQSLVTIDQLLRRNKAISSFSDRFDIKMKQLFDLHSFTPDTKNDETAKTLIKDLKKLLEEFSIFLADSKDIRDELKNVLKQNFYKKVTKALLLTGAVNEALNDLTNDLRANCEIEFNELIIKAHLMNADVDSAFTQYQKQTGQLMTAQTAFSLAEDVMGLECHETQKSKQWELIFCLLEHTFEETDAQTLIRIAYAERQNTPYQLTNMDAFGVDKIIPLPLLKTIISSLSRLNPIEKIVFDSFSQLLDKLPPTKLFLLCQIEPLKTTLRNKFGTANISTFDHLRSSTGSYPILLKEESNNIISFYDSLLTEGLITTQQINATLEKIIQHIKIQTSPLENQPSSFFSNPLVERSMVVHDILKEARQQTDGHSIVAFLDYKPGLLPSLREVLTNQPISLNEGKNTTALTH